MISKKEHKYHTLSGSEKEELNKLEHSIDEQLKESHGYRHYVHIYEPCTRAVKEMLEKRYEEGGWDFTYEEKKGFKVTVILE